MGEQTAGSGNRPRSGVHRSGGPVRAAAAPDEPPRSQPERCGMRPAGQSGTPGKYTATARICASLWGAQETQEPVPLYRAQLSAGQPDSAETRIRHGRALHRGRAWSQDPPHERSFAYPAEAAVSLRYPLQNQVETTRIVTLGEQGKPAPAANRTSGQFQIGQHCASQRTKPAGAAVSACRTPSRNLPGQMLLPHWCSCRNFCLRHSLA